MEMSVHEIRLGLKKQRSCQLLTRPLSFTFSYHVLATQLIWLADKAREISANFESSKKTVVHYNEVREKGDEQLKRILDPEVFPGR